jgi:FMN phosphatase YigB (HAD superfamily)
MKNITHLLVDLDGTLVNGDRPSMRLDFITRIGAYWHNQGSMLQVTREMSKAADSEPTSESNEKKIVKAFANIFKMDEEQANLFLRDSVSDVFPMLKKHFSPVSGAAEFLGWAKEHYSLILATNPVWFPNAVQWRTEWGGVDLNIFHSFTHAGRMHSCKPRLEYYRELLEQEHLKSQNCLLIGNDYSKDLPANQIGIATFILSKNPGAQNRQYESLSVETQGSFAWSGNYRGLRELLEL